MTHDQMTAAVRASAMLAPTSAERHGGPYPISRTGERATASGGSTRERDPLRTTPSHGAQPTKVNRGDRAARPTPYPFQDECTCGHLAGDHQDSRSRSLTPAPPGLCLITDCDCDAFTHADDPVPHRIPHTPRHR